MPIAIEKSKPNPVEPGGIQEYIDELKAQKTQRGFELDEAKANLNQASKIQQSRVSEKAALEALWDRINATGKYAYRLIDKLNAICEIAEKVGSNTDCARRGIDVLLRTTRELACCWEKLYKILKDLMDRIEECLTGPDALDNGESIMKCLKDLEAKVNAAFGNIEAAVKATFIAYACSEMLDRMIHMRDGSSGEGSPIEDLLVLKGIKEKMLGMLADMENAGFNIELPETSGGGSDDGKCDDENERLAKIVLGEDGYYQKLKEKFETAEDKLEQAEADLSASKLTKTKAQAKYDSICKAYDTANEAKNC